MSELFTKTSPTEPGWYWLKFYDEPGVFEVMADKDVLFIRYPEVSGPDMDYINVLEIAEYRKGKANILFGPKIPSPEDLATFTPSIDVDITPMRSTTRWMDSREYDDELKQLIQPDATDKKD